MSEETEKKLSPSERFLNYTKGLAVILPILGALALGVINMFKGEPVAQQTWETVRDKLNEQSKVIDKLTKKVLYWQGHEAGRSAGAIYEKLQMAEKMNEDLMAKLAAKDVKKVNATPDVEVLVGKLLEERKLRKEAEDKEAKIRKRVQEQTKIKKLMQLPQKLKDARRAN